MDKLAYAPFGSPNNILNPHQVISQCLTELHLLDIQFKRLHYSDVDRKNAVLLQKQAVLRRAVDSLDALSNPLEQGLVHFLAVPQSVPLINLSLDPTRSVRHCVSGTLKPSWDDMTRLEQFRSAVNSCLLSEEAKNELFERNKVKFASVAKCMGETFLDYSINDEDRTVKYIGRAALIEYLQSIIDKGLWKRFYISQLPDEQGNILVFMQIDDDVCNANWKDIQKYVNDDILTELLGEIVRLISGGEEEAACLNKGYLGDIIWDEVDESGKYIKSS
ncbi:hypothetical protein BKA69DRAFT_1098583 [Paraphysoderma sedebokerense]|nr:hypothetical protein BKA69DRAFT_1098583 [Paraphysoderma sedebokerense]